ncbi:MAG TPA: hypothetical protein VHL31_03620 [Geminicoccus sp.]|jgi:hypothetical protein|uniref:hypothetical protein n=1 Tax=Geminicoccus sp. TaxID=2024832 RepID=UPI002E345171|nr:hypothetical protein [Geminicoccus sp.]HEX2525377.1 hypothetical protein [Geminicoccus sp.]
MRFSGNSWRCRTLTAFGSCVLAALSLSSIWPPAMAAAGTKIEDRVQLQRNAPRGMEFVPVARAGSSNSGKTSLGVDIVARINIDGNAIDNAYANVLPLDRNNNGKHELVHWNGHRFMRVYDLAGKKIWQVTNSSGRKQGPEAYIQRDMAAVLDLDGDSNDDILHCWQSGSTKRLVVRNSSTGKEIRSVALEGQPLTAMSYCRLSVYRKEADGKHIILVAHAQPGGSSKCGGRNWIDNWTRVVAFDTSLNKLWQKDTCDAGHHTAAVDADKDGLAEYFFVGKYSMDFGGKVRCTLQGWNSEDHVDGIRIAQLDPASSKLTAVAAGRTGNGAFDPVTCKRLWTAAVTNAQEVAVAQLDPAPKPLSILMTPRGGSASYVVNTSGKVVRKIGYRVMPMQNAELDGDRRTDEVISMFGDVFNGAGKQILSENWYWNLKGTKVATKSSSSVYDKWAAFPLLFDMDGDGRDELVAWGQSLIVVGRPR